jgi:hypothetical protein
MNNPEYTERLINTALKGQSPLDISVHWDGYYPDPEDDATFDVHFNEEPTNYVVWDRGSDLDVAERIGKQAYAQIDGSNSHELLASILIGLIEDEIAAGTLEAE